MDNEVIDIINEGIQSSSQTSASGRVLDYLKNQIVYRRFKIGDKLPTEPELCRLINVSRTAVREAIKILEYGHIVEIRRGDGTYISNGRGSAFASQMLLRALLQDVSNTELDEYRHAIELEVMRFVISNATAEDIRLLWDSLKNMRSSIDLNPRDFAAMHRHDMQFHYILANAARNTLLRETYHSVLDIFSPLILRNYQFGQAGITGLQVHELMINAIEKKDIFAANYAISESSTLCAQWVKFTQEQETSTK